MKMCFLDYGHFNCTQNFRVLLWFPHLTCGPAAWTSTPLETGVGLGSGYRNFRVLGFGTPEGADSTGIEWQKWEVKHEPGCKWRRRGIKRIMRRATVC